MDAPDTNQTTARLTEAGEIFLLACATMGSMRQFGAGQWPMVNKLRRDGFIVEQAGEWCCTKSGRQALGNAGYNLGGVDG